MNPSQSGKFSSIMRRNKSVAYSVDELKKPIRPTYDPWAVINTPIDLMERGEDKLHRGTQPKRTTLLADLQFSVNYLRADMKVRKRSYTIGVTTVVLVVFFLSILQNAIERSPVIFMKLTEDTVGETDLLLQPLVTNSSRSFFINQTDVQERLSAADTVVGTAPRWVALGKVHNNEDLSKNVSVMVLIIDSELEDSIGIGRAWARRPLGEQECYVSGSVLRGIGVEPNAGQRVALRVDIMPLLTIVTGLPLSFLFPGGLDTGDDGGTTTTTTEVTEQQVLDALNLAPNGTITVNLTTIADALGFTLPVDADTDVEIPVDDLVEGLTEFLNEQLQNVGGTGDDAEEEEEEAVPLDIMEHIVVEGIEDPAGKFPQALGNVIVVEKKWFTVAVGQMLQRLFTANPLFALLGGSLDLEELVGNIKIEETAFSIQAMYQHRFTTYLKGQDEVKYDLINFTNNVGEALGEDYPVQVSLPMYEGLGTSYFIRLFLDQLFLAVMAVLIILGSMLIYSLMISDVEDKTYEYGMLRALGLEHSSLLVTLLMQALFFGTVGTVFGLVLAGVVNIPAMWVMMGYAFVPPINELTWGAVFIGALVGYSLPLVANIVPIQRALSKTLRDSLDLYHAVAQEVTVRTIRLEKLGISTWQTVLSLTFIVMGFIVYYMIPYAFIFGDIALFLAILILILLGMVLGLSLVAVNLQPFLERVFLSLFLWGDHRRLKDLVVKNLSGHRRRNIKTALMFTTALAFIIFAASMFTLQAGSIKDNIENAFGADIVVQAPSWNNPLDVDNFKEYLADESIVDEHVFVTFPLHQHPMVQSTFMSTLGGYPDQFVQVYGMPKNYMDAVYTKYYVPGAVDREVGEYKTTSAAFGMVYADAVDSLYTHAGLSRLDEEPADGSTYVPRWDVVTPAVERKNKEALSESERTPGDGVTTLGASIPDTNETYHDYADVVVSEALREGASVDLETALKIQVNGFDREARVGAAVIYLAKARAMLRKLPGFQFSSYRQMANGSPVLITFGQYEEFLQATLDALAGQSSLKNAAVECNNTVCCNGTDCWPAPATCNATLCCDGFGDCYPATSTTLDTADIADTNTTESTDDEASVYEANDIPRQRLLIKLKEGTNQTERESVMNTLRNWVPDDGTLITDTLYILQSTKIAVDVIFLFFYVVSALASVLCFMGLWLSFIANFRENIWEFGVLRAVGLTSKEAVVIYVYEALALVSASVVLGSFIGISVAVSLTLQFNLFTEMPFSFEFPTPLFVAVVVMAMVAAVMGSVLPSKEMRQKEIAIVIRGN